MTSVQNLYNLLQSLQDILNQLAISLQRERSDIVKLDTTNLAKEGTELADLFSKIEPMNLEIKKAVSEACVGVALNGEHTISNLLKFVTKQERELLKKMQQSVRTSSEAINNALTVNKSLLNDSLQFTTLSMQMFTNALKQTTSTTYGQQGRFVNAPEQPHIICKEI